MTLKWPSEGPKNGHSADRRTGRYRKDIEMLLVLNENMAKIKGVNFEFDPLRPLGAPQRIFEILI